MKLCNFLIALWEKVVLYVEIDNVLVQEVCSGFACLRKFLKRKNEMNMRENMLYCSRRRRDVKMTS